MPVAAGFAFGLTPPYEPRSPVGRGERRSPNPDMQPRRYDGFSPFGRNRAGTCSRLIRTRYHSDELPRMRSTSTSAGSRCAAAFGCFAFHSSAAATASASSQEGAKREDKKTVPKTGVQTHLGSFHSAPIPGRGYFLIRLGRRQSVGGFLPFRGAVQAVQGVAQL